MIVLQSRNGSGRFTVLQTNKTKNTIVISSPMSEKKKRERTSETYEDAEREGGIRTSAGVKGAGAEVGGGSLATLVSDGAPGPEPELGKGKEVDDTAAEEETAPVSRETSLSEMALPVKNSPDVREGSIDGAGGKMSDWNESDFFFLVWCLVEAEAEESIFFVGRRRREG